MLGFQRCPWPEEVGCSRIGIDHQMHELLEWTLRPSGPGQGHQCSRGCELADVPGGVHIRGVHGINGQTDRKRGSCASGETGW